MRRIIPFLIAVLFGCSLAQAQSYSIRGMLQLASGEPVGFASVILKNQSDSVLVKAAYSTEDGQFILPPVNKGSYFLEISRLSIEPYVVKDIQLTNKNLDLGTLTLNEQDATLDEVEISAIKPVIEIQPDRLVFNVENSLSSVGSSAFELLRKAPGVLIDNSNNIIVEGKTGVQIYIDDKPSVLSGEDLAAYLQTLQASDIEAIEIITQPSSKYDAAGAAGIINIRLKRDKRLGFNGSINSGVSYWKFFRNNHSISLNHRSKRAASFVNYSNSFGDTWYFVNFYRRQSEINFDSETENWAGGPSHNIRAGSDIFLGDKSTIGVVFNAVLNDNQSDGITRTPITPFGEDNPIQVLIAENAKVSNSQNYYANVNYRYKDTLGRSWNIDLDYGTFRKDVSNFQPNAYYNGTEDTLLFENNYQIYTPRQVDVWTAKTDYEQKLGSGNISFGGKISYVSTDNTFNFFELNEGIEILDEDRSNNFVYTEQINAGYVNLSQNWKKLDFQAGLRVEQTISEGILTSTQNTGLEEVKRNYVNLFPSGGLSYKANYRNSFGLAYSRRIKRPNYRTLNPFESQIDELSFTRGNPFLQPQYTDNVKLSHTYRSYVVTSISYSYISDYSAYISDVLDETRSFMMTQNIADQQIINIGTAIPVDITKWWFLFTNLDWYRTWFTSDNPKFDPIDASTFSFYLQNTFKLPSGFRFEISGWFASPSVWGGTYRTKSLGSMDLGIQKKFMNDKLVARFAMTDVLFTSPWRGTTRFGELTIDGTGGWESRQVKFNLSYSFGNDQLKKTKKRKSGLDDESTRIDK